MLQDLEVAVREHESRVSTGIQDPSAIWHHSTSCATSCELLRWLKKSDPRSLLQVLLCSFVHSSKRCSKDAVSWDNTYWEQVGTGTKLRMSACSLMAKKTPKWCSLILSLFSGSCGYICALHGLLSSTAMVEITQNQGVIDHLELQLTHNDHGSPTSVPGQDHPKNHTSCLRMLPKCLLNSGRCGAMTTSLGSLFQCPQAVAQDNDGCLSHHPTICLRAVHLDIQGHFICPKNCYSSCHMS